MSQCYLVGVDGSEGSKRAARYAVERARASGARVLLAHVIEWSRFEILTPGEASERHRTREREIERAEEGILKPLLESLGNEVRIDTVVHHGHAAEILAKLAEEKRAAEVFIGRRGHSKLNEILFGSVVSNLALICPAPLTVVP